MFDSSSVSPLGASRESFAQRGLRANFSSRRERPRQARQAQQGKQKAARISNEDEIFLCSDEQGASDLSRKRVAKNKNKRKKTKWLAAQCEQKARRACRPMQISAKCRKTRVMRAGLCGQGPRGRSVSRCSGEVNETDLENGSGGR